MSHLGIQIWGEIGLSRPVTVGAIFFKVIRSLSERLSEYILDGVVSICGLVCMQHRETWDRFRVA